MKLKVFSDFLNDIDVLQYSQFTIDIVEELICECMSFESEELKNEEDELIGSISYQLNTLLEIMDKELPDYKLIESLITKLDNLYHE